MEAASSDFPFCMHDYCSVGKLVCKPLAGLHLSPTRNRPPLVVPHNRESTIEHGSRAGGLQPFPQRKQSMRLQADSRFGRTAAAASLHRREPLALPLQSGSCRGKSPVGKIIKSQLVLLYHGTR
jgi:hypothetical protein